MFLFLNVNDFATFSQVYESTVRSRHLQLESGYSVRECRCAASTLLQFLLEPLQLATVLLRLYKHLCRRVSFIVLVLIF